MGSNVFRHDIRMWLVSSQIDDSTSVPFLISTGIKLGKEELHFQGNSSAMLTYAL